MKKLKLIAVILLLVTTASALMAQSNFRKGYIITLQNDTVNGWIAYQSEVRNAHKCIFKPTPESEEKTYNPDQISAYRFNESGRYYTAGKLPETAGAEADRTVFFEYLVNGKANLYFYTDGTNWHYYIKKGDGQLVELTNQKVDVIKNNQIYRTDDKKYVGQLTYLFADAPALHNKIGTTRLNHESMIRITKQYHDEVCTSEQCIVYEKPMPFVRLNFVPFVSYNLSAVKFTKAKYIAPFGRDLLYLLDFNNPSFPTIGVSIFSSFPRMDEKLAFLLSLEFGGVTLDGQGVDPVSTITSYNMHIEEKFAQWKAGFQYAFSDKQRFQPTMAISFANRIDLKRSHELSITRVTAGETITDRYNDIPLARSYWGGSLEVGANFRLTPKYRGFVRLTYDYLAGDRNQQSDNATFNNFALKTGIIL